MTTDDPHEHDFWRRPGDTPASDPRPAELPDEQPAELPEPPVADAPPLAEAPLAVPARPGLGRLQRLSGTLAVVSLVVVGLLFAVWARVAPLPAAPTATPTPTSTITPVTIPDEARTKVYRSSTPASNEFRSATLTLAPALTAPTTNAYAVRVETSTNVDADEAARFIQGVLDDPRGWAAYGRNNFQLVPDAEAAKFTITIASPATADALCGAPDKTQGLFSCKVKNAIVINSDRWHYMVPTFNNVEEYRAYVVNHFTGQFLGQRLAFCSKKGEPAPAMAQQDTNLDGCLPNAWPKLK